MFAEKKQVENDIRLQDKLREAMIKQMEIGYQEMGAINLEISNEWQTVEGEADKINNDVWGGEW